MHLSAAFYAPLDDVYTAAEARVAADVVSLLSEVFRSLGHDPGTALRPLHGELEAAAVKGGRVPARLTRPVRRMLTRVRAGRPPGPLVEGLRGGPLPAPPVAEADVFDGHEDMPRESQQSGEAVVGGYVV